MFTHSSSAFRRFHAEKPARARILDAAHELLLTIGLARATTKEIAKAGRLPEAALYKHFARRRSSS